MATGLADHPWTMRELLTAVARSEPEMTRHSVADIVGPWKDAGFTSGFIERCKRHWNFPINELPDLMVATFLGQRIALNEMMDEARRRLNKGSPDGTELYDGQLAKVLKDVT